MAAQSTFWSTVTRLDWSKVTPWQALRNSLGVALPLAVGAAIRDPSGGLIVSLGALNVSFSDGSDPYRQRARRMLTTGLFCALAVFGGGIMGRAHVLAAVLASLAAFAAGMMVAVNQTMADLGTITLVTFVVFSAQSMNPKRALISGLLALAGGLLQTGLSLALWPVRRYAPERRMLGALYRELAQSAVSGAPATEAPPASESMSAAQNALAPLGTHGTVEAERYLALLNQAERIRLALLTLFRLRVRIAREPESRDEPALLDRAFGLAGEALTATGNALTNGGHVPVPVGDLHAIAEQLRCCGAMASDARWQIEALAGQLRSALELSAHATPSGHAAFEKRESGQPWTLRLSGVLALLRANLTLRSAAFRHALRLAVCIGIAEATARLIHTQRVYWVPMTVAIVLKPDFSSTFSRGLLRLGGTLAGALVATAVFRFLDPGLALQVVLLGILTFLLRCYGPANYGIFVTALTGVVVLMFAVTGISPSQVMTARAINTLAGGLIALTAYAVWPTWERSQVDEALAKMLEAYRHYFALVRDAYLEPQQSFAVKLDAARLASRLARSNLEASVGRLNAEPGVTAGRLAALHAVLANSHRFIHAVMSMEAGLARSRPVPARAPFRIFAGDVERTLALLAAFLRGVPVRGEDLPDLREDHNGLLAAGDPHEERYALVNVETDRVTNSLNTLAGIVLAPTGA